MSKKIKNPKIKNRLFLFIIIALVIALLHNVTALVQELDYRYGYGYELSSFDSTMKYGDYTELEGMAGRNLGMDYQTVYDCGSYESLGMYYRACLLTKAYESVGNAERAADYQEIAEQCYSRLEHYVQRQHADKLGEKYLER